MSAGYQLPDDDRAARLAMLAARLAEMGAPTDGSSARPGFDRRGGGRVRP